MQQWCTHSRWVYDVHLLFTVTYAWIGTFYLCMWCVQEYVDMIVCSVLKGINKDPLNTIWVTLSNRILTMHDVFDWIPVHYYQLLATHHLLYARVEKKILYYSYSNFLNIHNHLISVHCVYTTPDTSQRMYPCYLLFTPLQHSLCWGCGSVPPPGPGLHSGWLTGSLVLTILSDIRSIPLCTYLVHQYFWK